MTPEKAMHLPNAIVSAEVLQGKEKTDYKYNFNQPLPNIMWRMVSENPRLEFIAEARNNGGDVIHVHSFNIRMDGQIVGSIGTDYSRFSRVFLISNDLVNAERIRKNGYRTADDKKALASIRKTFVPKTIAKIVEDARNEATNVVNTQHYRKDSMQTSTRHNLADIIYEYVFDRALPAFTAYLTAAHPRELQHLNKYLSYQSEMITVDQIRNAFNGKHTYLVILDRGKYIVSKDSAEVNIYDDVTLPETLKAKLGMLKLVEPEQMVENVGCRASKELFVIVDETIAP